MNQYKDLARQGLRGALETRRRAKVTKSEPICVFDVAEKLDLQVRFCGGNSFGGMYAKASRTILVPSLRPPGRQAFTCAHELAHWYFGHGTRMDDPDFWNAGDESAPEERLANIFASYLLMPPWAVEEAFGVRCLRPQTSSALEVYAVATQLGVGYSTLVRHLRHSLTAITESRMEVLLSNTPKALRQEAIGIARNGHLVVADRNWKTVAIDLQVGDVALVPKDACLEGSCAEIISRSERGFLIEGKAPGLARLVVEDPFWASHVRVSRKNFEGRSVYRHLEDPDFERTTTNP